MVFCVPQAGDPAFELGIHGRCLGAVAGPSHCGQHAAGPQAILSASHSGCSDSVLSASLIRQSAAPVLPAAPQAATLAAAPWLAALPAVPGAGPRYPGCRPRGCGPPGGLGCIILRI